METVRNALKYAWYCVLTVGCVCFGGCARQPTATKKGGDLWHLKTLWRGASGEGAVFTLVPSDGNEAKIESYEENEAKIKSEIRHLYKCFSEVIKKFVNDYQSGCFTYISDVPFFPLPGETLFGAWVTAKTQETIQSGRALALAFIKDYLVELQNNKDILKFYAIACENTTEYSGELGLKHVGVRIAFWVENVERPKAPCLAEIDFYEDKFQYYEADPKTQALKLVLEESYEDAVNQLEAANAQNLLTQ
jgi:hypothetical protein